MISLIKESATHKLGAAFTGTFGGLAGGWVGAAQGINKQRYLAHLARLNKDKKAEWKAKSTGTLPIAMKGIAGAIPGVGAVSNTINQIGLDRLKDKISNHPALNKR